MQRHGAFTLQLTLAMLAVTMDTTALRAKINVWRIQTSVDQTSMSVSGVTSRRSSVKGRSRSCYLHYSLSSKGHEVEG